MTEQFYNPFSLAGKTILVTGASSGIGRAIAIECSKMGAALIITGRDEDRLQQTYTTLCGNNHKEIVADLTKEEELKSLIDVIDKIDGAVLCAGIGETLPIAFCSQKKLLKIFETNLFSYTEIIRLLLKGKKYVKGASFIAISSIASYSYELGNSIYGASKSALSTWFKYAARELGPKGIRLNCICPGVVETPIICDVAISKSQFEENKKMYPLGRFGKPEDIAYGAIFLLSNASSWITGIDLTIDGGNLLN